MDDIIFQKMKLPSLSDSHYEIGYDHGKTLAGETRRFHNLFLIKLAERDVRLETAQDITRKFGTFIEEHTPDLLDEVMEIADGAQMDYESVLSLNCMFEIPRIAGRKEVHYYTVWSVTDGKKCFAAQNLDLASEYGEFLTLAVEKVTNGFEEALVSIEYQIAKKLKYYMLFDLDNTIFRISNLENWGV